ncbi:MAG: hypothetical protein WBP26_02230 [Candidatus Saccharimonadales bacterium]
MLKNRDISQTKTVLQSFLPEQHLVKRRNALALFFKHMRNYYAVNYGEPTIPNLLLIADGMCVDIKGLYKKPDSNEHNFRRVTLRGMTKPGDGYSFNDPVLNSSRLELHTRSTNAANTKQLITDVGRAAVHLIHPEDECQGFGNITAISYPELIRPLIRMGMEPTPVSISDDLNLTLTLLQRVYSTLNNRPAPEVCEPVGVYMPTTEFIERFSRFAA